MKTWKKLASAAAIVSLLFCVGCPAEGDGKSDGDSTATDGDADTDGDSGDSDSGDSDASGDSSGIDVSDVKKGQKYTYAMQNNMEMVYEVTELTDTEVKYTTVVIMNGKPTADPTPQTMALPSTTKYLSRVKV